MSSNGRRPLHVTWDMTHAGRIQTGTGGYARNLMAALGSTCGVRVSMVEAPRLFSGSPTVPAKAFRGAHQLTWTQLGLRRRLQRLEPDIVHAPAFVASLFPPCPLVVTVHDMAHVRYPQHFEKPWLWYLRFLLPLVGRRAHAIIAQSAHAKSDVERLLRLPGEKVHAVYPGVDHKRFRPLEDAELDRVRSKYGLSAPFVLHVGNLAARKNIPILLQAVARLKRSGFWSDRHVILAGGVSPGLPGYVDILSSVERLGLESDVRLLGHVPDSDLPAIYNLADTVVMPSLHEGFGLPVAEAMACGRPVIASDRSSLPEVAGGAALLADPRDSEAWAEALARVLENEALRDSMIEQGLKRAATFTWERTAAETLDIYRGLSGGGKSSLDLEAA